MDDIAACVSDMFVFSSHIHDGNRNNCSFGENKIAKLQIQKLAFLCLNNSK